MPGIPGGQPHSSRGRTRTRAHLPAVFPGLDLACEGEWIPFTAQEDPPSMSVAAANYPSRSSVARYVTETSLALASIGLVGLHVVDDNFLQPEPA